MIKTSITYQLRKHEKLILNHRSASLFNDSNMIKGKVKVDSCRVSIPLIECEVIDTNIIDRIHVQQTNIDTGELIGESLKNGQATVIQNDDGTYLKFWKENQFFYQHGQKVPTLYITFLINSKHLKQDYFQGITSETLKQIHEYILSFKIVSFTFESLYKARFNDTDICVDFNSTVEQFDALKKHIKQFTVKPNLWHTATNKNNSGIWSPTKENPRDNAKPSTPFLKFYSKEEDFTYQSIEFARAYLKPEQYKDLYRVEATVKNSQHKKLLAISKVSGFGDFLKLDLQLILQSIVKSYFEQSTQIILKENELKPIDKLIIDLVNLAIFNGVTKEELFLLFNRKDISRQARQLMVEKYHMYTMLDEFNREKLEKNSLTHDVFSYLGISVKD